MGASRLKQALKAARPRATTRVHDDDRAARIIRTTRWVDCTLHLWWLITRAGGFGRVRVHARGWFGHDFAGIIRSGFVKPATDDKGQVVARRRNFPALFWADPDRSRRFTAHFRKISQRLKKPGKGQPQSPRQLSDALQRGISSSPLDVTHISTVQLRAPSQFLLGNAQLRPPVVYGDAKLFLYVSFQPGPLVQFLNWRRFCHQRNRRQIRSILQMLKNSNSRRNGRKRSVGRIPDEPRGPEGRSGGRT
jgi:hypothetical protein